MLIGRANFRRDDQFHKGMDYLSLCIVYPKYMNSSERIITIAATGL